MRKYILTSILAAVGISITIAVVMAFGHSPQEVIRTSNNRILAIYSLHDHIGPESREKIIQIMNDVTEFGDIADQAVRGLCQESSELRCRELKTVFTELLRLSAIRKLGRYRADRFDYNGQEINKNTVRVKTIAYYKTDKINLDYIVKLTDNGWKIINYIADEVDTIKSYRRQFIRILRKESIDQLIIRLKTKVASYRAEDKGSKTD